MEKTELFVQPNILPHISMHFFLCLFFFLILLNHFRTSDIITLYL